MSDGSAATPEVLKKNQLIVESWVLESQLKVLAEVWRIPLIRIAEFWVDYYEKCSRRIS